jgi:Flp pilus assembly protein TadD
VTDPRDDVALKFKAAAENLERAAAHCRIAAKHYTDRNVPAGCAHAFAALGDMAIAHDAINENAKLHAGKAQIFNDPGFDT